MMGSASRRALYTGVTAQLLKRVFERKHDLMKDLRVNTNVIASYILRGSPASAKPLLAKKK
jgi:predicted GIY-YIG superfamily endonuclease